MLITVCMIFIVSVVMEPFITNPVPSSTETSHIASFPEMKFRKFPYPSVKLG